jgi:hypothetical protein
MKNTKLVEILLSAVGSLSIFNNRSNLVNLNKVSEVFDHFYQAPISKIDFPKIAYEKDFYKDCITEELKEANYKQTHISKLKHKDLVNSLVNETFKLNKSLNNNPKNTGNVYLKNINKNGKVGVGKNSEYYFNKNGRKKIY